MNARAAALPALAVALVAGVLGVQVANGGGDFVPAAAADACAERAVTTVSTGLDGLTETLVLFGLDAAACQLGETREGLLLRLAQVDEPSDAEVEALRTGLRVAVDRMDAEGRLPKVSALKDEALERAGVPGLVSMAIKALPDDFLDSRLATDDLLRRSVDELDVRALILDMDDPGQVQSLVGAAVTKAAIAAVKESLPNPFG